MAKIAKTISIPLKTVGGRSWGDLNSFALSHEICGERVDLVDNSYSFAGGHRVRLYKFKKNVHWAVPMGIDLEISDVPSPGSPRKQPPKGK